MSKKSNFKFKVFTSCFFAAAFTFLVLSFVSKTARLRVAEQYIAPDYVRYIAQGYSLDTVSNKKNYLLTVTDGYSPVRVHVFTFDVDKNTLDILDIPPNSYIFADGFKGIVSEAYETDVYSKILSASLCMKFSGEASFDAVTLGDGAQMLGCALSEEVEASALDFLSYSENNEASVKEYRLYLAKIFKSLSEKGSYESFSILMNLIVNRVETDMTVENLIEIVNFSKDIRTKKINIRIARGSPAVFEGQPIWALNLEEVADQLNKYFRVKDSEVLSSNLGIPDITVGEFSYESLPERVTDIK